MVVRILTTIIIHVFDWFSLFFHMDIEINFQTDGMDSWVLSALKSILRGPYFWIGFMIFRYYPQIHFYIHFWNPNSRKKFLDTKKISFSKADF